MWSPRSDAVAFSSADSSSGWKLLARPVDRADPPRQLWTTDGLVAASTWSFDGRTLGVYQEALNYSIGFLTLGERTSVETVPNDGRAYQLFPSFSPDGRYVAYASTETGRFEIWVRSFPDGRTVKQISVDGGLEPVWCENGELFYRAGEQWMVVSMTTTPELSWEPPQELFVTEFIDTPALSYDVSPDGQRILLIKRTRPTDPTKLHLVVNWFEELKGRERAEN